MSVSLFIYSNKNVNISGALGQVGGSGPASPKGGKSTAAPSNQTLFREVPQAQQMYPGKNCYCFISV